ncbi:CocE/NonD family hydrolase [Pseudooceanicola sp. CBS1P-1]|uniref:CocE/NonD family hydrolase n=1 Tax=Pseudooceanicola albus TaxID=2692189 RepID=A0A6L7G5V5_9RHOB|nr:MULTISPECIES: CocE/NonD family hydrolase [Pseudooceanicola]MBT9385365.1 CocE/NonD family hydrolase [Pseudooceanicola endophyticus]MXN18776.1 CocE/NonD family hydrolase [Pseudooceanicola albus]
MSETHTVSEEIWIPLKDGTKLATRIWMPACAADTPVPTVLEYLPYRKRGGTDPRDESTYPVFAEAGIAGVRVDIRGSGESDGVIDGEYTPRELSDACEVLDWIAAQPWSNGNVGMMGISWGGFNCLQVAALKPEPLKAVISIASTVDRYNDDIHYKNGTHLSAQLSWAGTMLAYQSRSPDKALVGDSWREMWLERLKDEPFFMEEWLSHQRRDAFWEHGSICEDFEGFPVPALVIAGWADGYRNTPLKAIEGMPATAKAMIGPWIHKYPHFAWPKPRADFHAEAIAWWKKWLSDEDTGAEALPQMRAYILDAPRPAAWRDRDPGYWVAKAHWSTPSEDVFSVGGTGALARGADGAGVGDLFLRSPLDTGIAAGEWFTLKPDAEIAGDQRIDNGGSLCFETAPLEAEAVYLGAPKLTLNVACAADWENLAVRIIDVHPDGTETRACYGVLNLAHRDSYAEPKAMPEGMAEVTMQLDAMGYRFAPGHRIKLALSTSYWPLILPSPEAPGLVIDTSSIHLALPELGAHERITVPEPENPSPLPVYEMLAEAETRRTVVRDQMSGLTHYRIYEDTGLEVHPTSGLQSQEIRNEDWSIGTDPTSSRGEIDWEIRVQRPGWETRSTCRALMTCTKTHWQISAEVVGYEDGTEVHRKSFAQEIPRDFM